MTRLFTGRFFTGRWWHGWRGWLIFVAVAVIGCIIGGIALARAFSPAPDPWSQYPGVPQFSTDQILANQTIEELAPRVDTTMTEIRDAVTKEFGLDWVAQGAPVVAPEPNRYGGTSLLNTYDSVTWQTIGTIRDDTEKKRLVALVTKIMASNGFGDPELLNTSGPEGIQDFGGFTLADQGRWVLAGHPPEVSRGNLELTILDLTKDRTGILTAQSDAAVADLGWEPEYVSISFRGEFMLSEADRGEFERRAARYAGHIAPVPGRNND